MNPEAVEANSSSASINLPSVDNSKPIAADTVLEQNSEINDILGKEYKDPENVDITDQKDNRTVNDSEISTSKEKEIKNESVENEPTEMLLNELNESKNSFNVSKESENYKESAIDEQTLCGICSFHPKWIQKYATPRIFLLFFSIVGIINGAYAAYFVSIITTLEKRYAFKTKVSGGVLLSNEITPVFIGVFVGYFGGRTHRPRMVTYGMFFSAACCFVASLPYFVYGSAKHLIVQSVNNVTDYEVCATDVRIQNCDVDDRPPTMAVVGIFVIACLLKGFADTSYYVIGISFIDDNIKKTNTPVYLAIAFALRLFGPLLGYLTSSAVLNIYENPFEDPGFGPDDPRWVGAWWIGFVLQGVLLVIFTLPIGLFPRRLPTQKKVEKILSEASEENIRDILRDIVTALKRLGKNPIYVLMLSSTILKIFGHFGHQMMLPKYMETQFRLSAADASLFSGATSIFCIMMSTLIGGFIIWKYRPRTKVLLGVMVMSEILSSLGFLLLMIPRCEPMDLLNFGVNDEGFILNSVCNQNCDCSTKSFTPFCGPDGKTTYFSPCYAGCTQEISTDLLPETQTVFGNCSCVSGTNWTEANTATITEGYCPDENCWSKAIVYLIILFIMLTISNTLPVAHTMILLRSVHPSDKTLALGAFETFMCLLGLIPFPITYGALVDSACLVWEENCGDSGNCWFYDTEKYGYLLHSASSVFCALSAICIITMFYLSSRVRDLYMEEDENEPIDNIKLDNVS